MLIRFSLGVLLFVSLIYLISCSDNNPTQTVEEEIKFISYQIPGCNSSNSFKKKSLQDSCFDYSFNDTLKVDFCVLGNCCPDSNRFATDYRINLDTIFVTVLDTAQNLCRCICNYVIHIELSGLSNDNYLFFCKYDTFEYSEIVNRSTSYKKK